MGKRRKTSAARPSKRAKRPRRRVEILALPPPEPCPTPGALPNGQKPPAPPPELVAIGNELRAVKDPLQGNALAHRALLASMADILIDESLTPAQRRKELRTTAAAAKDLLPDARRAEVDRLIKEDRQILEAKSRQRKGAKLEPVPDEAKVIQIIAAAPLEPIAADDFGGESASEPSSSSAPGAASGE